MFLNIVKFLLPDALLVSCVALLTSQSMSDSESSSSDNFEDAVESVEIHQSPTSKAKRNTMKRSSDGTVATVELPPLTR